MTKKKILMISDHALSSSGVGVQARYLINGLLATGRYSFFNLGGALKHTNYDVIKVSEDFIIKPIDGFGDRRMITHALAEIKPDALLLFTDPRFFEHIWSMEDMIHDFCPIAYNTIWDNYPVPKFNSRVYKSCDLINCINEVSYNTVSQLVPEYKEFGMVNYIPHGVPPEVFKPISPNEALAMKQKILGKNADHFIGLYVSRNARRKMPADIIYAWSQFLNRLEAKTGHRKATLVMHTNPFDMEGPNLIEVANEFGVVDNVMFSSKQSEFNEMNILYGISDFLINISCAEGFGLPVLEAKMCGKPVIAIKTGGLTKQVVDDDGFEFGIALEPDVKTIVGSQQVPFIYEDFVTHESTTNAIMKMYDFGPQKRAEIGQKAREHAHKNYNVQDMVSNWDVSMTRMMDLWSKGLLPNNKRYIQKEF